MRAALFVTCLNDTLFPSAGKAAVRLLERLGVEVDFPLQQTCCGQMHMNSGHGEEGLALARRTAEVFADYDVVVTPSASCAGMLRKTAVGMPIYELSEFLCDVLGTVDVGAHFPHRVALHPTCHSLRELRVGDRARRLLGQVEGIELVELERAEECCGFGGTFAVRNADTSTAMLTDKLRDVIDSGVEVVCAADSSCLMQIGGGLSRGRSAVQTAHLTEVLAATAAEPWRG
jgi:L-lactate dehydrogenase complex protein LldE